MSCDIIKIFLSLHLQIFFFGSSKVSASVIFILTVGIVINCSFAVQCLLFQSQHPRSGWLLAAASLVVLVNLLENLIQIKSDVFVNASLVMFCMLLAMANKWLPLTMVRL
jgi:hypothetical protein